MRRHHYITTSLSSVLSVAPTFAPSTRRFGPSSPLRVQHKFVLSWALLFLKPHVEVCVRESSREYYRSCVPTQTSRQNINSSRAYDRAGRRNRRDIQGARVRSLCAIAIIVPDGVPNILRPMSLCWRGWLWDLQKTIILLLYYCLLCHYSGAGSASHIVSRYSVCICVGHGRSVCET